MNSLTRRHTAKTVLALAAAAALVGCASSDSDTDSESDSQSRMFHQGPVGEPIVDYSGRDRDELMRMVSAPTPRDDAR